MTDRIRSHPGAPRFRCSLAAALVIGGCTPAAFVNNTASLGGTTPGRRSNIQMAFINNTPFRAVFTFGTYDPQNTAQNLPVSFRPKFQQFFVDEDGVNQLNGFTDTDVITFVSAGQNDTGGCGRAMSLGGERLVQLIEENDLNTASDGRELQLQALRPICDPQGNVPRAGIAFFAEASPGPGADACDGTAELAAYANPVITLQGATYQCDSLLVYTFEQDNSQPGGVRVDLEVILP
jgi:hypothetical protein